MDVKLVTISQAVETVDDGFDHLMDAVEKGWPRVEIIVVHDGKLSVVQFELSAEESGALAALIDSATERYVRELASGL